MAAEGDHGIPRVVGVLTALLERATERNDAAAAAGRGPVAVAASSFRATRRPPVWVRKYMERIARFAQCSPACFVAAYVYLDRHGALAVVDSCSVHRLLIAAVLAAVKFMDAGARGRHVNAYFAAVGGITLREMNHLELVFLFGVGFDLNVPPETFGHYCDMLRSEEMLCLELERLPPPSSEDDDGAGGCLQQQRATNLAS